MQSATETNSNNICHTETKMKKNKIGTHFAKQAHWMLNTRANKFTSILKRVIALTQPGYMMIAMTWKFRFRRFYDCCLLKKKLPIFLIRNILNTFLGSAFTTRISRRRKFASNNIENFVETVERFSFKTQNIRRNRHSLISWKPSI